MQLRHTAKSFILSLWEQDHGPRFYFRAVHRPIICFKIKYNTQASRYILQGCWYNVIKRFRFCLNVMHMMWILWSNHNTHFTDITNRQNKTIKLDNNRPSSVRKSDRAETAAQPIPIRKNTISNYRFRRTRARYTVFLKIHETSRRGWQRRVSTGLLTITDELLIYTWTGEEW